MSANVKYILITAAVVVGTLYVVQHVAAVRNLVYGAPSAVPPSQKV